MGIQEGLDAIKAYKEEQERRKEAADKPKTNWLNIPDGKTYEVRFLQELDKSGAGYSEKNGLGFFATEHSNPDDFRKKALCTIETGECYGCEQKELFYKAKDNVRGGGWKAKSRLYINVLVRDDKGEEYVAVMSQPNGTKSVIAPMLVDEAVEQGTITNAWWKITRTGKGSETAYRARIGQPKNDVNPEDYELFDLKNCIREVDYEDQPEHFSVTAERPDSDGGETRAASSSGKVDTSEEW